MPRSVATRRKLKAIFPKKPGQISLKKGALAVSEWAGRHGINEINLWGSETASLDSFKAFARRR